MFLYESIGVWILETYGAADKFESNLRNGTNTWRWGGAVLPDHPVPYKVHDHFFSGVTGLNSAGFCSGQRIAAPSLFSW